jgi:hypothetical protein
LSSLTKIASTLLIMLLESVIGTEYLTTLIAHLSLVPKVCAFHVLH